MRCTYVRDDWACGREAGSDRFCASHAPRVAPVKQTGKVKATAPHTLPTRPRDLARHVAGCEQCLDAIRFRPEPVYPFVRAKVATGPATRMAPDPTPRGQPRRRAIPEGGAAYIREWRRSLTPVAPKFAPSTDPVMTGPIRPGQTVDEFVPEWCDVPMGRDWKR